MSETVARSGAAMITVGTSAAPVLRAVEEAAREAGRIVLVYGRSLGGQQPAPIDVAGQARERALALGLMVEEREVEDPEDLDKCLRACREVIERLGDAAAIRVDFTAGTKAMAAGAVHAALTSRYTGPLRLTYIGGRERGADGRVRPEAMDQRVASAAGERYQECLELARACQYRDAAVLARALPAGSRSGYLRELVAAFAAWDDSRYGEARDLLRRQEHASEALREDAELGSLAARALRLGKAAGPLADVVAALDARENGRASRHEPWERMPLLAADTLENAARRQAEGRPTDSVLRAYRAVEVAVQGALLQRQLNPWRLCLDNLEAAARARVRAALGGEVPARIGLHKGRAALAALGLALPEEQARRLQTLQDDRNRSYLEHGYRVLGDATARQRLADATAIAGALLGADLAGERAAVRHAAE